MSLDENENGLGLRETLDLEGRTRRNPHGMLAAALGVGFVLGGGLSSRVARRILWQGLRVAALPLIAKEFAALFKGPGDPPADTVSKP